MKQREIKFRAWDNDAGSMVSAPQDGEYIWNICPEKGIQILAEVTEWREGGGETYEQEVWRPIDCVIMQFTGLLDKNGREIYEGDVIKWIHKHGDFEPTEQVSTVEYQKYSDGWIGYEVFNDAEIIGNLYENPELLK